MVPAITATPWIVVVASALAGVVFVVSFRRVLSEVRFVTEPVAAARLHHVGHGQRVSLARARAERGLEDGLCVMQAGFIAAGITTVVALVVTMFATVIMLSVAA